VAVIPHHNFVVFRNHVLNLHMKVGKTLERPSDVLDRARGSGRGSGRNIRAVIHKIGREVQVSDVDVLSVHELFKMVANELAAFGVRHSSLRVDRLHV